jgi:hypothetical protein
MSLESACVPALQMEHLIKSQMLEWILSRTSRLAGDRNEKPGLEGSDLKFREVLFTFRLENYTFDTEIADREDRIDLFFAPPFRSVF